MNNLEFDTHPLFRESQIQKENNGLQLVPVWQQRFCEPAILAQLIFNESEYIIPNNADIEFS